MPEAPAVVTPEGVWTYHTLEARIRAAAAWIAPWASSPGRRIALWADNQPAYLIMLWALWRLGHVACAVSTRLPPDALPDLLRQVGADRLVTDRVGGGVPLPVVPLADLPPPRSHGAPDAATVEADRPATILFTSGSTGRPKGARHPLRAHLASALGSNANIALAPGDRWLLSLPLYHVGGLSILFRCALAGAAVVVPPRTESLADALGGYGITHSSMVATQLWRLLRAEVPAVRSLKAVLLGGSAIPSGLLDAAVVQGLPVHTTYGLTEMASQVTTTPPGASRRELATSGRLLPYRELRLAEDGEICVRGATRFEGYMDDGGLVTPFDGDGWFRTGDLGRLDEAGFLHVIGRLDNRFISGGENVHPETIERALVQLPGIERAIVVPVPDAEFGQRPVAFVQRAASGAVPLVDLADRLRATLPGFMVPVAFYPWPEALDTGMKVNRAHLEQRALAHR